MADIRPAQLIGGVVVALALLGGVAWSDWYYTTRGQEAQGLVSHSREVQTNLARLLARVEDIETGARGFVITGEPSFLEPFLASMATVDQQLEAVRTLTRDNPTHQAHCDALERLIAQRAAIAQANVDLRRSSGFEAAQQAVASGAGTAAMDLIRAEIAEMEAEEEALLNERLAASRREARAAEAVRLAGTSVSVGLFVATFTLVLRENRLRQRTQLELLRLNEEMDQRIRERTAELDAQRRHNELLLNSAGEGLYGLDLDGCATFMNPAGAGILGYSVAELLGQPMHAKCHHTHADGRPFPREDCPIYAAFKDGRVHHDSDDVMWRKDGSPVSVEYTSNPLLDDQGRLSGAIVVFRDITERKRAEVALRETHDQLAKIVATTPGIVCSFRLRPDGSTCVPYGAGRIEELYGLTPGTLAEDASAIFRLAHPDDVGRMSETVAESARTLTPWRYEWRVRNPVRGEVWLEGHSMPLREPDGSVLWHGVVTDITERKQAVAALGASEERFAKAFKASPDAIAISRVSDRRIIEANNAWQTVFGVRPDEVIGRTADELDLLPQPADRDLGVSRLRENGYVRDVETVIRRASGEIRDASISAAAVVVGGDPCFLTIVRDITDWKRAENDIRRLNAELEQRVQERTRELADANKELESFSYSVSHDLRAPLRHVQGYVEMLQRATDGQLSATAQRYLKTITDASVEMGRLIDDLLDFSRTGRAEMRTAHVQLDALVQEAIRGLEMATDGRHIVWQTAPLPPVVGDPSLLKQVLANLIDNAMKYSRGRDPARIEIGCAGEEDGRVILFVRDNGAGFDMQYAHKLFGVFQRLHRAEEFEGTGIGLATVRRVVARHGGRVWAEGAVNEGATFYFTLPRSPSA